MGLRINTNTSALFTSRILRNSTNDLNRSLERLSSGLRINRARDDAAGLAIAEGLRSVATGSNVAQRNSQDGISLVQTAEGALATTTDILQRIRELAIQSSNGTNSDENRAALDLEVQQLLAQVDDIAFDTEFNGLNVLAAPLIVTLQAGAREGQTLDVNFTGGRTNDIGVDGLSISSFADAQSAISTVDAALRSVTSLRATLGAQQNRLEFTINTLAIQEENARFSESQIRDADIATETSLFTRNQILVSSGTAVLAQSNVIPQTALQLLGG